jgi:hypothetical protein
LILEDGRSPIDALSNAEESVLHFLSEFESADVNHVAEMIFAHGAGVHLQRVAQVQRALESLTVAVGVEGG